MRTPLACTIVANNYLAYARAFTRSFLDRHPAGKVCVLIVDRPQPGHRYEEEPFAVTFADQLGIPGFEHFSFRYSIVELSTAVKPWFLLHLHRTLGVDRVCYFDPDILIFGDLGQLYDLVRGADAVLTPHLTAPIDDSLVPALVPGEREILLSGIYNLGFLGLAFNERTLAFLDWWKERLYRWCLHEVDKGLFVDQRWMDLAPAFLPRTEILREPGYNVAYWNLSHRRLTRHGGSWWVADVPLRFFHFSGYDFNRPDNLSKFQNRFTFAERPDVLPLFELYGESIRRQGQQEVQDYPYGYGRFANGVAIPDLARRTLRRIDPDGVRWPDPFATTGPDSFFDWLRQPVDGDELIPLPRLALLLWDHREDLQRLFARPWAEDRMRFAQWFVGSTHSPERIDPAFTAGLEGTIRQVNPADHAMARLASLLGPPVGELETSKIIWLTADAGYEPQRRPRVSRLALEMHRQRADLLRAYPDPLGADRLSLALWFVTYGRHEYRLPKTVVLPVLRTLPWRQRAWARLWWERQKRRQKALIAPAPSPGEEGEKPFVRQPARAAGPAGFNVIGWSTAPTGVGEACRGTLVALERAGIGSALWPLEDLQRGGPMDGAPGLTGMAHDGMPYEVSLYHVNADMMETVHSRLPLGFTAGRHRIGYWFWELAHFPVAFAGAFRHTDEVWAPSRFCQQAFQSLATVEVRWMPPCVVPATAAPASRQALGIGAESFLFFFAFDALSVPERKNPAGLLAAFAQVARERRRPVHLLIKVNHAESDPGFLADLRGRCAGLPVTLLTGTLSRAELDGLTAACDAYVSLHRSEGLGLPLIEAMYLRKPVIATGYGGVTDFLDEETGFVVRHGMTALSRPQGPYPAGTAWAEPDAEHAAALMLALAEAPEAAAPKVAAARRRVTELYAPEAAGHRFRRELERIRQAREGCHG